MKINTTSVTCTVQETQQWLDCITQLTAGGGPKESSRNDWQRFRWAMSQNYQRVKDAWNKRSSEINSEREKIIVKICGSLDRYAKYDDEMRSLFQAFGVSSLAQHQWPSESTKLRFGKRANAIAARYTDVGQAHEEFMRRQAEMLEEKISIDLICCDYSEVPDDINCSYIDFISVLLMGVPKMRFWHSAVATKARRDKEFSAILVGAIHAPIVDGMNAKKTAGEIAMDVFRALYQDKKEEKAEV